MFVITISSGIKIAIVLTALIEIFLRNCDLDQVLEKLLMTG